METIKAADYAKVDDAIQFAKHLCRQSLRRRLGYRIVDAVGSTLAEVTKTNGIIRIKDERGGRRVAGGY